MEPCLFRHGKGYDDRPGDDPEDASMEPCLFRHGKTVGYVPSQTIPELLQWSHVFSDMVRGSLFFAVRRDPAASMEPCLFRHGKGRLRVVWIKLHPRTLQWSHVFSDMVRSWLPRGSGRRRGRFNGAMSFQTW